MTVSVAVLEDVGMEPGWLTSIGTILLGPQVEEAERLRKVSRVDEEAQRLMAAYVSRAVLNFTVLLDG